MSTWLNLTWRNFLKQNAALGGLMGSSAKLVLQLGGTMPSLSKINLDAKKHTGKLNDEEYQVYADALDIMMQERQRSKGGFTPDVKPDAWLQVKGGHMKKTHIDGFYDGYQQGGLTQ